MLGYIYSAIALFTGTAKGYCGKKISEFTTKISDAIHISALRMAVSAIFGFLFLLLQGKFSYMGLSVSGALCVLWSAIANSAFVVLWLCCVHSDAYMLVEVALTLGVPIAVCGSACIPALNETLRMNSVIGMLALVIAAVLMQGYNRQMHRERLSAKELLLLIALPISSGLADLSQKYYIVSVESADAAVFSFYTFLLSALILGICCLLQKQKCKIPSGATKKILLYTAAMAICLFANMYFKTMAAAIMSSAVLYPLLQCCSMLLSLAMSALLLKEKPTLQAYAGVLIAVIGIVIINLK